MSVTTCIAWSKQNLIHNTVVSLWKCRAQCQKPQERVGTWMRMLQAVQVLCNDLLNKRWVSQAWVKSRESVQNMQRNPKSVEARNKVQKHKEVQGRKGKGTAGCLLAPNDNKRKKDGCTQLDKMSYSISQLIRTSAFVWISPTARHKKVRSRQMAVHHQSGSAQGFCLLKGSISLPLSLSVCSLWDLLVLSL